MSVIEYNSEIQNLYDIVIIRKNLFRLVPSNLLHYQIRKRPYVIIPVSLMTAQRTDFQNFMEHNVPKLRKLCKNLLIVVGGWHATGHPEDVIHMGADFVILGESEISFPKFLADIKSSISSVAKIYVVNESVDLNKYPPYSEKYRVFCPIEISRGCPFRCKFCQTGHLYTTMRHVAPENIVRWIKRAVEIRYDRVWFTTPNAFAYGSPKGKSTNPVIVKKLLHDIKAIPNLDEIYFGTFPSEIRPEYVTTEMMEAVHPFISNKFFTIGVQSASDKLLKSCNRAHTFQQALDAIELILGYGYGVDLDFIFGLPGETEEDITLTLQFFRDILKSSKKIRIHTHTFMPLPGTPYSSEPVGQIAPELEKILGQLASRNKAYGSHEKQSHMK